MSEQDAFQAAIDDDPDDHVRRLVFADWLEDRDDPRAEGYRALGLLRRCPRIEGSTSDWLRCSFDWNSDDEWVKAWDGRPIGEVSMSGWQYQQGGHVLPASWAKMPPCTGVIGDISRADLEDTVAILFSRLEPKLKKKFLGAATVAV
ncbi:TIGR02996 domain-containing protein [Limnoglobus roseus]|uniref:TIGR02996 domain-containing protein n=1 Tax=Limnoglobus roseus TaxID=2598579 RepID=A0A5C1ATK2_9BACT|nr:TIGR02996 domain-containing protein [Limnoglobus roseus]QEL20544.1 TIGR02996 domain-containing protein [Limnoglobus roseus]